MTDFLINLSDTHTQIVKHLFIYYFMHGRGWSFVSLVFKYFLNTYKKSKRRTLCSNRHNLLVMSLRPNCSIYKYLYTYSFQNFNK